MSRGLNKEMRQIVAELRATPGWAVSLTGSNKFKVTGPRGGVVFLSQTPSRYTSITNGLSQLRRAGWQRPSDTRPVRSVVSDQHETSDTPQHTGPPDDMGTGAGRRPRGADPRR